jgi:hypothetical protein
VVSTHELVRAGGDNGGSVLHSERTREAEWNEEAKGSVGVVFSLFTQARVMPWRSMRVRASHTTAEV